MTFTCPICQFECDNTFGIDTHIWECHRISITVGFEKDLEEVFYRVEDVMHEDLVAYAIQQFDWERYVSEQFFIKTIAKLGT